MHCRSRSMKYTLMMPTCPLMPLPSLSKLTTHYFYKMQYIYIMLVCEAATRRGARDCCCFSPGPVAPPPPSAAGAAAESPMAHTAVATDSVNDISSRSAMRWPLSVEC